MVNKIYPHRRISGLVGVFLSGALTYEDAEVPPRRALGNRPSTSSVTKLGIEENVGFRRSVYDQSIESHLVAHPVAHVNRNAQLVSL